MAGNLTTALRRRKRAGDPMQAFDRLPRPVRLWLHEAVLPWSPASAARVWAQAVATGADPAEALARHEAARLARERAKVVASRPARAAGRDGGVTGTAARRLRA